MTATRPDQLLAVSATGMLAEFNAAGVLGLADVHTARALARMAGGTDEPATLAAALTVRALRMGSVCIDLTTVADTAFDESDEVVEPTALSWPEPAGWAAAVTASPLVAVGEDEAGDRPLRFANGLLYLERYWQQEEQVRQQLQSRFAAVAPALDLERLAAALTRLFPGDGLDPGEIDRQARAAAVAALSRVTVLAGGPGTGKTTTVARLLAVLNDQPGPRPRVALAAPTGKAAARLSEAVRDAAAQLPAEDRARLGELSASTLHRLLGWVPDNRSRFRHNAHNHLPHDVVIVDEMSMVSLTMMARLLEAVRPDARLVLVGDPDQLSSVEAGAVLADIAQAPGAPDSALGSALVDLGLGLGTGGDEPDGPVHGVVQLTHTWRFGASIDELARAIRRADEDAVVAILRRGSPDVAFVETDLDDPVPAGLEPLSREVRAAGTQIRAAAQARDIPGALRALDRHRLLCAHRRGSYGVARWSFEIERWLAEAVPGYAADGDWYLGRPVLVTANDYELGLFNGDTGVVVDTADGVRVAFARGSRAELFAPVRLDAVQTVHAMTVHRAQGSQFDCVSFLVPPAESPLLTRELLYTAVTRAVSRVQVFGTEDAVRMAVRRPVSRASGLRPRLG